MPVTQVVELPTGRCVRFIHRDLVLHRPNVVHRLPHVAWSGPGQFFYLHAPMLPVSPAEEHTAHLRLAQGSASCLSKLIGDERIEEEGLSTRTSPL